MDDHDLPLGVDNPILRDFGFRVIEQFFFVIALPVAGRIAYDFHHQVGPIPNSIVASMEVVAVQKMTSGKRNLRGRIRRRIPLL